ncbi:MAG: TauD/TfdA dioxygenase family protein [Litorivicinaceae bacterium]
MQCVEIGPGFVGRVTGLDVSKPVSAAARAQLNAWLDQYLVLVLPKQPLTEAEQITFSSLFGTPSERSRPKDQRVEESGFAHLIGLVTNVRAQGEPIGSLPDGEMWFHHDGCFIEHPYRATVLRAVQVTSTGGETLFVDMRQVYAALPEAMRHALLGRSAIHVFDYRTLDQRPNPEMDLSAVRHAEHPVVIRHPQSGEPALYVNPLCTVRIQGLPLDESEALLTELTDAIAASPACYRHRWSIDDVVIWDNWGSCHARTDFPGGEVRMLRRSIVSGQALQAWS